MNRLRQAHFGLLCAFLLVATACSGSPGTTSSGEDRKDTADSFRLASTNTLNADSMRFSVNINFSPFGQVTGEGFQDLEAGAMTMRMNMPPFEPGMPAVTMDQIFIDTTLYMQADLFSAALPPGKRWMKIDLAALGDQLGLDLAGLVEQSRNSDPRGQLSFLQGVTGEIEELGTSEIRGTKTTHYKFMVNVQKAVAELPPEFAELAPMLEAFGVSDFPAEAWVDDDGLVRRVAYTVNLPADPSGSVSPGAMNVSMDFFDFGAEETVSAPPAGDVVDFMEALRAFSG